MREILTELGRRSTGGGGFRWTTILIVAFVVSTQVFVVYNVQGKMRAASAVATAKSSPVEEVIFFSNSLKLRL